MFARANLSFGNYRRGTVYLLPDAFLNEQQAMSLVGAGYFTVDGDDRDHNAADVPVPSDHVVGARPKRKRKVADGQGEVEPGTGEDDSEGVHDAAGGPDDQPDQPLRQGDGATR